MNRFSTRGLPKHGYSRTNAQIRQTFINHTSKLEELVANDTISELIEQVPSTSDIQVASIVCDNIVDTGYETDDELTPHCKVLFENIYECNDNIVNKDEVDITTSDETNIEPELIQMLNTLKLRKLGKVQKKWV